MGPSVCNALLGATTAAPSSKDLRILDEEANRFNRFLIVTAQWDTERATTADSWTANSAGAIIEAA